MKSIGTLARVAVAAFIAMATDTIPAAEKAATFLKTVEGFRATAYHDATGRRTIGYGFTAPDLVGKTRLTEAEASAELSRICSSISNTLRIELKGQRLTPSQEAAVISFIYNVGWANFRSSTMFRLLKSGKRGRVVADEFTRWVYVTKDGRKVVCKGLMARRERERRQFMS